uniref:SCP domain-containing protein n=1 Tax=Dendroctonus ponderosae TaxID=77166 RepID=A0AAR5PA76_DENPD
MSTTSEVYILLAFLLILILVMYGYFQKKLYMDVGMLSHYSASGISVLIEERLSRRYINYAQANQTTGNISGHVPGQNAPPYPDAYLSIEHIIVENELNKSQKCTEAPPSYEEAMRLALAHSNSLQTYEVEQRSANQQLGANQATSSATPIAPTHQPTALPLERF